MPVKRKGAGMINGMPGPGGSLGCCSVCGKDFLKEIMLGRNVSTIKIDGIDGDLCLHAKCLDQMKELKGGGWENLPAGPLRDFYEDAAREAADAD